MMAQSEGLPFRSIEFTCKRRTKRFHPEEHRAHREKEKKVYAKVMIAARFVAEVEGVSRRLDLLMKGERRKDRRSRMTE